MRSGQQRKQAGGSRAARAQYGALTGFRSGRSVLASLFFSAFYRKPRVTPYEPDFAIWGGAGTRRTVWFSGNNPTLIRGLYVSAHLLRNQIGGDEAAWHLAGHQTKEWRASPLNSGVRPQKVGLEPPNAPSPHLHLDDYTTTHLKGRECCPYLGFGGVWARFAPSCH